MFLKLKALMDNAKPENRPVIQYAAVYKFFVCVNSNQKRFRHVSKKVSREDIQN